MSARIPDLNGWYEIPRNPLAKAGVFPYTAKAIQAPGWEANPSQIYQVYRPESELADPETLASMRLLPWVDNHAMLGDPKLQDGLTPPEQKGVHGVIGEQIEYDRDSRTLFGNIKLWSASLADAIDAGKKELSLGWRCVYEFCNGNFEGQPYQAVQRMLRGNHNALVDVGRMGPDVAVLDHFSFTLDAGEIIPMAMAPTKIKRADRIAKAFGLKDRAAVTAFVNALDADDEAPAEGDGDMTLSQVAALLKTIAPQVQGLTEAMAALSAPPADEADEMEPMLDEAGAPVMDEAGKPKMQKKVVPPLGKKPAEGIAATDAAELKTRMAKLEGAVGAIKAPTVKDMMAEVARRDALASQLSEFVGTFDASEKTLAEVAAYGVEKLGIPGVTAGSEVAAVSAYLFGRQPPRQANLFALDGKEVAAAVTPAAKAKVDAFLSPAAA